jgi:hypothetical protein
MMYNTQKIWLSTEAVVTDGNYQILRFSIKGYFTRYQYNSRNVKSFRMLICNRPALLSQIVWTFAKLLTALVTFVPVRN